MTMTEVPGGADVALQATMQTSLFGTRPFGCGPIRSQAHFLDPNSAVLFGPQWVEGADHVFERLRLEMPWQAMRRPMYERIVDVPRLICTVSADDFEATHPIAVIACELSCALGVDFDRVGLNFYRTGADSVAWHRDRFGPQGRPGTVALVSVGSPRALQMRPLRGAATTVARRCWRLGGGDLLVMTGGCQRDYEHCVPKESNVGPRISLALRSRDVARVPVNAVRGCHH